MAYLKRNAGKKIGIYVAVIILAAWTLIPLVWMLDQSFQIENDLHHVPPYVIPKAPTILNYVYVFDFETAVAQRAGNLGGAGSGASPQNFVPAIVRSVPSSIANSFIVAGTVILVNLVVGALGGYAFSRYSFKGSMAIFVVTLTTLLMPPSEVIVPVYVFMRTTGLLDTIFSIMLVHAAMTIPFSMYITFNFMKTIPTDIEDAARVEGYSRFETYRKVVFPVIKPALVVVCIFSFMLSYREFFFAYLLTSSPAVQTYPVILAGIAVDQFSPISIVLATGVIGLIPPLIIIALFRRYIITGLISGAMGRA